MPAERGEPYSRFPFVKIYSRESLEGSLRFENEPDVRSVWWDLVFLANESRNRGVVQSNPTTPYPHQWLANKLVVPLELLESALAAFKEQGRIEENAHGITVINFAYWQGIDTRSRGRPRRNPASRERVPLSPEEGKALNIKQDYQWKCRQLLQAFKEEHDRDAVGLDERRLYLEASEASGYLQEEHRFLVRCSEMDAAFQEEHGREPDGAEDLAMRRQATEETGFDPSAGRGGPQ